MEIKVWAVVWTREGRAEYRVPKKDRQICIEHPQNVLAVFSTRKEAVEYLDENGGDFEVVSAKLSLPKEKAFTKGS